MMVFNKKISYAIILLFVMSNTVNAAEKCDNKAEKCSNLTCVRNCIDSIDSQIVTLIGKRLAYVKRAGEIKNGTIPIHDQKRENQILKKVCLLAEKQGYSGDIAKSIYKTILEQSNYYELRH